ncbi:(d)CMP kinase [Patescibacteria group bacterium]
MKEVFQIAIDGPVGAGSSTVARLVSERLGFLFVDTGAMYRAITLLGMRAGVDLGDERVLVEIASKASIEMKNPSKNDMDGRLVTVLLDGEDVSWQIRTKEVSANTPLVASLPKIREVLVKNQQEIASMQNVVMEGRDITYKVLPSAQLKIYLTASEHERANRRYKQLLGKGENVDYKKILEQIKKRDEMDMNREADPLKIVEDAWVLDTTDMTIEEVVSQIFDRVERMRNGSR